MSLYFLILYAVGSLIDHLLGTTFFRVVPGLLLPITTTWSLLTIGFGKRLPDIAKGYLSIFGSAVVTATIAYIQYVYAKYPLTAEATRGTFLAVSVCAAAIEYYILQRKAAHHAKEISQPSLWVRSGIAWVRERPILLACAVVYLSLLALSAFAYPFLPEADGYSIVTAVETVLHTGEATRIGYRPFFPLFLTTLTYLSGIKTLSLLKYYIPLIVAGTTLLTMYHATKGKSKPLTLSQTALTVLLPATIPVILLESQYARPQSMVIMGAFVVVQCAAFAIRERSWVLSSLSLGVALACVPFHEFGLLLVATALLSLVPRIREDYQQNRQRTIKIGIYVLLLAVAYGMQASSLSLVRLIIEYVPSHIVPSNFTIWFLDSYHNYDGNNLGWPGWQALLFYGYNLGFVCAFLIGIVLLDTFRKTITWQSAYPLTPALSLFGISVLGAEILPRLGVPTLPDRLWLYIAISLCFLLAPVLASAAKTSRTSQAIFALAVASWATSIGLVSARQGWVQTEEYRAAQWISSNTPTSSRFVSQTGNGPLIITLANRTLISQPQFFFDSAEGKYATLTQATSVNGSTGTESTPSAILAANLRERVDSMQTFTSASTVTEEEKVLHMVVSQYAQSRRREITQGSAPVQQAPSSFPVYILYSERKFDSPLYGQRSWWKNANAFGAPWHDIHTLENVEEVYNEEGVHIWRFTPPS